MSMYQRFIVVLAGVCSWVLGPAVGFAQDSLRAAAFTQFIEGFKPHVGLPYHVDALDFFIEGIERPQIDSILVKRFLPLDSLYLASATFGSSFDEVYAGPLVWNTMQMGLWRSATHHIAVVWYTVEEFGSDGPAYGAFLTTFTPEGIPIDTYQVSVSREGFKSGDHSSSTLVEMENTDTWGIVTSELAIGWDAEKWAWDDDPPTGWQFAIVDERGDIKVDLKQDEP